MSTIVFLLRRYLLHEDANEDARHIITAEKHAVNELGRLDISRSHLFTDWLSNWLTGLWLDPKPT